MTDPTAQADQMQAALVALAGPIAAFYHSLIKLDIPSSDAADWTRDVLETWIQASMD